MEIKKYLMQYETVWSRIRFLERRISGCRADSMHYISSNRIGSFEYENKKRYYLNKKAELCDEIRKYKENISKDNSKKVRIYIDPRQLSMISNNGDYMGKVFSYNGEIYRGLYKRALDDFFLIWGKGVLQVLGKHLVIPEVTISEYYTDEFPLIIHTKKVSIQKNTLWSYAMVKDACILVSFLNDLLHEFGLTLMDGHLNNITFDKGRPVFVDVGSVIPYTPTAVQEELVFGGVFRLLFGYLGNCMLYRLPSHDNDNSNIFIEPRFYNQMTREYRACLGAFKKYHWLHGNRRGRNIVHRIFDLYSVFPWDIDVLFPVKPEKSGTSLELENGGDFIGESIIDIGGGAEIIKCVLKTSNSIKKIKFIDFLEKRLDDTYNQFKSLGMDSVFALYNYIYAQNGPVLDSLRSATVLCVDPFKNNASFHGVNADTIAYALNRLGKEGVVVVFMDERDVDILNKAELKRSLSRYYSIQEYGFDENAYSYWMGKRKADESRVNG